MWHISFTMETRQELSMSQAALFPRCASCGLLVLALCRRCGVPAGRRSGHRAAGRVRQQERGRRPRDAAPEARRQAGGRPRARTVVLDGTRPCEPPDGKWLTDEQGRKYFVTKMPRS